MVYRYFLSLIFSFAVTIFSGVVLITYNQCGRYYAILSSKLEINVFLKEGLSNLEIAKLGEKIRTIKEVKEVYYVNKNTALRQFMQNSVLSNAITMVKDNPLPSSFVLVLRRPDFDIVKLDKKLNAYKEVDGVFYNTELVQRLNFMNRTIKYFRICLGIITCLLVFIFLSVFWKSIRSLHDFWRSLLSPIFLGILGLIAGIFTLKLLSIKIIGSNLMYFSWKQLIFMVCGIVFANIIFRYSGYESNSLSENITNINPNN